MDAIGDVRYAKTLGGAYLAYLTLGEGPMTQRVRGIGGGTPEHLDLLLDPVTLCDEGLLSRREDG